MDSSPDLSLKLRRGSNDSRDSFYMDFAQGIDSDIEEVETIASSGPHAAIITTPNPVAPDEDAGDEDEGSVEEMDSVRDNRDDNDDLDDDSPTIPIPPPPPPLKLDDSVMMEVSAPLVPSPSSPNNAIVSPETLSHQSSPAKSSRMFPTPLQTPQQTPSHQQHSPQYQSLYQQHHQQHQYQPQPYHVTIDETSCSRSRSPLPSLSTPPHSSYHQKYVSRSTQSSPPPSFSSNLQLARTPTTPTGTTTTTTQHLAVLYHSHHHHLHPILTPSRRPSRLPETKYVPPPREIKAGDALATTLSALYGKLLVVMGIAFPMAEVISTYIPPSFYESFYLYLYIGSIVFLLFMYITLLWGRPKAASKSATTKPVPKVRHMSSCSSDSGEESDHESESSNGPKVVIPLRRPSILAANSSGLQHLGSFYLRMGAVAFGIGSMIYSGLEFGQYFELERDTKCHNVLLALTPATRMAFIFIQMYFIFLNNEQIKVYRHKILARFGLMHMIGTNLSVWFSVLIQETKHEILTFYDPENRTLKISHRLGNKITQAMEANSHSRIARGLKGPHNIFECRRTNIIGTLVQDASPFLFPCTIEYSLICAAILYVMWRNISRPQNEPVVRPEGLHPFKRSPHHYSVDCARAHKGLFIGILMLVLTIISLILFFVLISRPEFVSLAVTEVNICELTLYGTTTAATLIGMVQVRHLQYDAFRSFSLDDILLVGAQTGSFLYSTFTVIGGHFTMRKDTVLVLVTALASLVETACQTMFILDASRRSAATPEHIRKKPGREIVTFLLVSNLAMWAINTLEKSRAESHPIQLHFYGLWAWSIITHVSMPLAIFYRFHSTVCLCEIWKRAYKMKPAYM